jgi:hypothetical protein
MAGARRPFPHVAPTWFAAGRASAVETSAGSARAGTAVDLSRLSQSNTPFSQSEKVSASLPRGAHLYHLQGVRATSGHRLQVV